MKILSCMGIVAAALCCALLAGCDEALIVGEGGLTPTEALSRLRAQRAAGDAGPKRIVVRGRVQLSDPIVLSAADGNLTIHGEDGAVLSGGFAITGWTDRGSGVWGAKLPVDAEGRPVYTESLFVNGRRAQRARYPADGGFFHAASVSQAVCSASVTTNRIFIDMRETDPAMRLLAATSPDELAFAQILAHVNWDAARNPITAVTNGRVVLDAPPMRSWAAWRGSDFYAFENVRAAFVSPGQWFYDAKAGEVLYRPLAGEEFREAIVPHAGLETLVAIDGATNVVFEGVAFAHSAPTDDRGPTRLAPWQAAAGVSKAAIVVDRSADIVFRNCRFEHLGGYAVWFREGCRGGGAFACEMTDLGAGGVRIGVLRRLQAAEAAARTDVDMKVPYVETAPWMTSHITVEDCEIAHGGRFHPAGVGVFLTHASDCSIVHNDIFDLYYTGISVGWVWGYSGSPSQRNTVAFNHIHDIGQEKLADMGGIYTLGASFGTCVSNNVIHAIRSYSYGGWGLYTDEGSEGVVMENNLVYDTNCEGFHQHYGRNNIIRNNIFAYPGEPRAAIAVTRGEGHRSFVFENNIVYFDRPAAIRAGSPAKVDWKGNCWWRLGGKPFKMLDDLDFGAWQKLGNDLSGVVADPKFRDPANRDFTLAPDSPALACGFRPFDFSLAGRRRENVSAAAEGKSPKFAWRGYMLDVSRHFFTVDDIKKTLDLMREQELNVFHWHLTDSAGWRLEIDRYPELTATGSVRKASSKRHTTMGLDVVDGDYGPFFYTKSQVREIIRYAAERGISIVPEIEFPGHSAAAIRSRPELGCANLWNCGEYCLGRESTFEFFRNVLDEVCELFPGGVIHVGGDECSGANWKKCADCQSRIRELNLADAHALQGWATKRIATCLAAKGRRMMGWDELAGWDDLPRDVIIQSYRGATYGVAAAKKGFDVVMSPDTFCYLDYVQGLEGDLEEYQPFGVLLDVAKIARFDPYAGVPEDCRHHILGGQGNLWTELVPDRKAAEWRTWPRLAALADVLKNGPAKDVPAFMARMGEIRESLVRRGVNAAPLGPLFKPVPDLLPGAHYESLKSEDGKRLDFAKMLDNPLDFSVLRFDPADESDSFRHVYATRDTKMAKGTYRLDLCFDRISMSAPDDEGFKRGLAQLKALARPKRGGVMEFTGAVIVGGP